MDNFNLNGYTLPLSSSGDMSLVKCPPWYFGGDLMEIISVANGDAVKRLLPTPLEIDSDKTYVSITMVDMLSASSFEELLENPNKSQYKECLIKIYCQYNGKHYWYVPISWVTTDFSLLRGFVMGFGKRIGSIHMTRTHSLNPLIINERMAGISLVGMCYSTNDISIKIKLKLERKSDVDIFAGTGMLVMKHFPGETTPEIHSLSQLKVEDYNRKNYWLCDGEIIDFKSDFKELQDLGLGKIILARTFTEGFKLLGSHDIYAY